MSLFGQWFGSEGQDNPLLQAAIERAVSTVEPLLKQSGSFPDDFRKPVSTALEYVLSLTERLPGPVEVNRESYARDPLVHALFPSVDSISEAICLSRDLQEYYRRHPEANELCALMGMRRFEKTILGVELNGEMLRRDVVQKVVYFTSHTIENPAPTEQQAKEQVALSFLDSLACKVKKRVLERRHTLQTQLLEKDQLMSRLRLADEHERPALEAELTRLIASLQTAASAMEPENYLEDFEAVMLNPEQHLRLSQTPLVLDRMGILQPGADAPHGDPLTFSELLEYDRRNWTVTLVHCNRRQIDACALRTEQAYRSLVI